MPVLSRSRSLRQPGYTHRELIEDGQQKGTVAKYGVKHKEASARPATQEHGTSEAVLPLAFEKPQGSTTNSQNVCEGGSERTERACSPLRSSRTTSTRSQEPRRISRPVSGQIKRNGNAKANTAAASNPSLSGLPLPNQLSRSSSLRQPVDSANRSAAVKRLHSRNKSVAENTTGSTRMRILSTDASSEAQEGHPVDAQLMLPPPSHASTASKPVAAHRRSQSSGVMVENGRTQATIPGAPNRVKSLAKPQFSTYQQQYSPRKPEPQIEPVMLPSVTSLASTDFDHLTALQDELLQLQWIFFSSHKTLQRWTESGERKINGQHKKHVHEACKVKAMEQNQQNFINGAALRDWLAMMSKETKPFDKVESLSQCVQTLADLTRSNETLSQVIEQFGAWYENTIDILGERSSGRGSETPRFIQSVGEIWAEKTTALVRSLRSCLRSLQILGPGEGSSGLGLVLDLHIRYTEGILEELNAMETIHSMALDQENDWINCRISALLVTNCKPELSGSGSKRPAAWDLAP
jgi:CII-binding regulator of phage lambda lysogenization HflD